MSTSILPATDCQPSAAGPTAAASVLGDRTLLAGILFLTAILFLPALRYAFAYDDQGQIVENPLVQSWRYVPEYFQGHVWSYLYPNAPANYYRPVNVLWFRINHALFGLDPLGWHASTIALHLLATALAFAIVRRITARSLVAGVAALLFGIHPTPHEVAAWVSGSTESLCAVLFLSSFLAYLISREKKPAVWMSVSCALYALSLLAKETAIVLPALVLAHAWLYPPASAASSGKTSARKLFFALARASIYAPFAILYLVLRVSVLHGFSHPQNAVSLSTLLLTLPSVLFFYGQQWLLPIRMSEFYDLPFQTSWNLSAVLLPLLALSVAAIALWCLRRRLGARGLAFAASVMLLTLAPALYVSVFPAGELVHDRYAYLPGLGAALAVALLLQPLCVGPLVFRLPRRLVLALLAVIVPLAYSTANASSYWVDDLTLFEHAHQAAPQNLLARNNYAVELSRSGRQDAALGMLQDLAREHPGYFLGNYNLGRVLYEINLVGAAEHYLREANRLQPDRPEVYLQLGLVSMKAGRTEDALSNFTRAAALQPRDATARFALGVVLAGRGDCSRARAEFTEALTLKPDFTKAREQMNECGAAATAKDSVLSVPRHALAPSPAVSRPAVQPVAAPGKGL